MLYLQVNTKLLWCNVHWYFHKCVSGFKDFHIKMFFITFSQLADHGLLFAYGYVILTLTHLNVDISRNQRQANGRCGMKAHAGLK